MTVRRTLTWIAVAALGVGLTTGMTITTTLLSQQPIALASEPLSAGDALAAQKAPVANVPTVRHRRKAKALHRTPGAMLRVSTTSAMPRVSTTSAPQASMEPVTPVAPVGTPAPSVTTRVVRSGSSGDQAGQDTVQSQEGDVQSEQRGADD